MKKLILIFAASFGSIFLPSEIYSQEEENTMGIVNQDDLGNVTDEFQEYFFEGLKQKGIENYEKAITALEKCRSLEPENPVVYFELGKNYAAMEQYEKAEENFQKAQELAPEREDVLAELYHTYSRARDYEKAIPVVQKLISKDNSYTEDLANLYMLNADYDKALEMLDELDARFGATTYRNTMRRQIYARTNNTSAQIGNLEEGIASDPENEQNYLNLIYIYSDQGNEEEAFRTAQELLQVNPGSNLAHLALYKFYLSRGNPEEAINSMKIVFESEEIDAESKYKVLNDFLNFVNDHPEYQEDLMEVSRKLSEWEEAPKLYEQLGQYYMKNNRREDALTYFELGLEENPDNFELIKGTILLQLEFSQFEKASALTEEALEIFPAQPVFYLLKGVSLNGLQQYSDAEEMLISGLDYLIEDKTMEADFYSQLAISYRGMKNAEKAEEYQQKAEKLKNQLN